MSAFPFLFKRQHLQLLPQKAIFWKEASALIIADLHLGKSAHFRKAGIAIPSQLIEENLFCLQQLITQYHPQQIIMAGDLFHSEINNEWQYFKLWRQQFTALAFHLVKGNHDILHEEMYADLHIRTHEYITMDPFLFVHDKTHYSPLTTHHHYLISGHVHPGIKMKGSGKQNLYLPCFYFGESEAILPAFGKFTGLYPVKVADKDRVFVITGEKVLPL